MMKTLNQVRIIAGMWRGRKLAVPNLDGLRPTPDRVRETLFNWLGQRLDGWTCLDVFAGSGAIGFEALSRGADYVVMNDVSAQAHQAWQKFAQQVEAEPHTFRFSRQDGVALLKNLQRAESAGKKTAPMQQMPDIVFIDPPFGLNLHQACLEALLAAKYPGFIYLESDWVWPGSVPTEISVNFEVLKQGRAGQVAYHLLQIKP